jgi:hypothetical protein
LETIPALHACTILEEAHGGHYSYGRAARRGFIHAGVLAADRFILDAAKSEMFVVRLPAIKRLIDDRAR